MAFGRRKRDDEDFVDDLDPESRAAEDAELLAAIDQEETATPPPAPTGPWDLAEAPVTDPPRLDLGALHVPVMPDTDVRLEVSPEGEVVAATLVHSESALQLNAFAAPRTEGIWQEVRSEIVAALGESGGTADEGEGTYGPELRAMVPTDVPGQGVVLAPARFVGVDGPRWFLRGLLDRSRCHRRQRRCAAAHRDARRGGQPGHRPDGCARPAAAGPAGRRRAGGVRGC